MDHSAPRSRVWQEHGLYSAEKRTARGQAASGPMVHPAWALSQATTHRTVEARQSVIVRNPIVGFALSNPTLRQSPIMCAQCTGGMRAPVSSRSPDEGRGPPASQKNRLNRLQCPIFGVESVHGAVGALFAQNTRAVLTNAATCTGHTCVEANPPLSGLYRP